MSPHITPLSSSICVCFRRVIVVPLHASSSVMTPICLSCKKYPYVQSNVGLNYFVSRIVYYVLSSCRRPQQGSVENRYHFLVVIALLQELVVALPNTLASLLRVKHESIKAPIRADHYYKQKPKT